MVVLSAVRRISTISCWVKPSVETLRTTNIVCVVVHTDPLLRILGERNTFPSSSFFRSILLWDDEGAVVGRDVGSVVFSSVGKEVGNDVGSMVGRAEGTRVGSCVGAVITKMEREM